MKQCKNPDCDKQIPDTMNYCSEECLAHHIESKTNKKKDLVINENKYLKITPEKHQEIQQIYDTFGFNHSEGSVIGKHNTTILTYLIKYESGTYESLINRLTWLCHMSNRTIRENYLKGIESFGIIETFTNEFGVLKWRWIGIKALNNGDGN